MDIFDSFDSIKVPHIFRRWLSTGVKIWEKNFRFGEQKKTRCGGKLNVAVERIVVKSGRKETKNRTEEATPDLILGTKSRQ